MKITKIGVGVGVGVLTLIASIFIAWKYLFPTSIPPTSNPPINTQPISTQPISNNPISNNPLNIIALKYQGEKGPLGFGLELIKEGGVYWISNSNYYTNANFRIKYTDNNINYYCNIIKDNVLQNINYFNVKSFGKYGTPSFRIKFNRNYTGTLILERQDYINNQWTEWKIVDIPINISEQDNILTRGGYAPNAKYNPSNKLYEI
jgi:hypothetical protein